MAPCLLTDVLARTSDRKSTRLNSSHADIYTLSLHDALPIYHPETLVIYPRHGFEAFQVLSDDGTLPIDGCPCKDLRSEEHTSELQSRRYLHSVPTRRSSDLSSGNARHLSTAWVRGISSLERRWHLAY